jgi:hypothetical protein
MSLISKRELRNLNWIRTEACTISGKPEGMPAAYAAGKRKKAERPAPLNLHELQPCNEHAALRGSISHSGTWLHEVKNAAEWSTTGSPPVALP